MASESELHILSELLRSSIAMLRTVAFDNSLSNAVQLSKQLLDSHVGTIVNLAAKVGQYDQGNSPRAG